MASHALNSGRSWSLIVTLIYVWIADFNECMLHTVSRLLAGGVNWKHVKWFLALVSASFLLRYCLLTTDAAFRPTTVGGIVLDHCIAFAIGLSISNRNKKAYKWRLTMLNMIYKALMFSNVCLWRSVGL